MRRRDFLLSASALVSPPPSAHRQGYVSTYALVDLIETKLYLNAAYGKLADPGHFQLTDLAVFPKLRARRV